MKKNLLLLFFLLSSVFLLNAQNISVESFQVLPIDKLTSSPEEKRIDQNGEVAALIKVVTTQQGFLFEGGSLGVVDTRQEQGEIWVWVPRGLRKITIKHQQLGVLRDYYFPVEIEAERTYKMVLSTIKVEKAVKPAGSPSMVKQQYLVFRITPPNALLEVDGERWEVDADGTAMRFVNLGTYSYRVHAPNYHFHAGTVTVSDPDNTVKVTVELPSISCVEVTFEVDGEAEIWLNNEKKGLGEWRGALDKGIYTLECKQFGHETTQTTVEITEAMAGQTITLSAPKPIYGSLNVESTPVSAMVYIDGKEMGEAPKYLDEILIGDHEVKLTIDGYAVYKEWVVIEKGERAQVKADLRMAPDGAVAGLFSVSEGQQVYFSTGNLQYRASTKTWRFAENQWDYVGYANLSISETCDDWIDLFGWGTSGYAHGAVCYQPWSISTNLSDYSSYGKNKHNKNDRYDKTDWGCNAISNGGNVENTWRTLTFEEWEYVFWGRKTPSGIHYAKARVNNVNGVILLPDDWNSSYYSFSSVNNRRAEYVTNIISLTQWNILEHYGAVFLPAAGNRHGTIVNGVGSNGYYWSASYSGSYSAWDLDFYISDLNTGYGNGRDTGFSVRLVRSAM